MNVAASIKIQDAYMGLGISTPLHLTRHMSVNEKIEGYKLA